MLKCQMLLKKNTKLVSYCLEKKPIASNCCKNNDIEPEKVLLVINNKRVIHVSWDSVTLKLRLFLLLLVTSDPGGYSHIP